ncbi:MAG: hypothetical protein MI975_08540 [Cytophagales bacterium]|nr:hypothetical protein [Cytophagales bacterium]
MDHLDKSTYGEIIEFQQLIKSYRAAGIRMKRIADQLSVQPSVLSALYTTVFPEIVKQGPAPFDLNYVEEAFRKVNNVSVKFIEKLGPAMRSLKQLDKTGTIAHRSELEKWFENLNRHYNNSYEKIGAQFDGIYHCYTISSNQNKLKQDVLLITSNESAKTIKVKKGNKRSGNSFAGYLTITNELQVSIQLINSTDQLKESETIYFNLPIVKQPTVIMGILSGLDYNRQPISRRIVLQRLSINGNSIDWFNVFEVQFIDDESLDEDQYLIFKFLNNKQSTIRSFSLPDPLYSISDLEKQSRLFEFLFDDKNE